MKPAKASVKRFRGGDCSRNNEIRYEERLLRAPKHVIESTIIHELCHIVHHNHSKQFWTLVHEHCPNHDETKKWLRVNARGLLQY